MTRSHVDWHILKLKRVQNMTQKNDKNRRFRYLNMGSEMRPLCSRKWPKVPIMPCKWCSRTPKLGTLKTPFFRFFQFWRNWKNREKKWHQNDVIFDVINFTHFHHFFTLFDQKSRHFSHSYNHVMRKILVISNRTTYFSTEFMTNKSDPKCGHFHSILVKIMISRQITDTHF